MENQNNNKKGITTMDTTEIVSNEVENVENVVQPEGNALGATVIIGVSMAAGAFIWSKIAKPVGQFVKTRYYEFKDARETNKKRKEETTVTIE